METREITPDGEIKNTLKKLEGDDWEKEVKKEFERPNVTQVKLYKPGQIIQMFDRAYEVQENGSWRRLRKSTKGAL